MKWNCACYRRIHCKNAAGTFFALNIEMENPTSSMLSDELKIKLWKEIKHLNGVAWFTDIYNSIWREFWGSSTYINDDYVFLGQRFSLTKAFHIVIAILKAASIIDTQSKPIMEDKQRQSNPNISWKLKENSPQAKSIRI